MEEEVVWDLDTDVVEPTVIKPAGICYSVKTSTENCVVQALDVTSLLSHFRTQTLYLVMGPNPSPLSLILLPSPTEGQDSSHMGSSEWICQCCGEVIGSRG